MPLRSVSILVLLVLAIGANSRVGVQASTIPTTCIGSTCYSCPEYCDEIQVGDVSDPSTCRCSGSSDFCNNDVCTAVASDGGDDIVSLPSGGAAGFSSMLTNAIVCIIFIMKLIMV